MKGRLGLGLIVDTPASGNCSDLSGIIFDWSDYKQADTFFVNTLKRISEYAGTEFKHGWRHQVLYHQ